MIRIDDQRTKDIRVRVTEMEKEDIKKIAASKKLSVSDYIRTLINLDLQENQVLNNK